MWQKEWEVHPHTQNIAHVHQAAILSDEEVATYPNGDVCSAEHINCTL